jgi:hypothetical protein
LIKHDGGLCQLCSFLAPDIPNLFLTVDEFVLLCASQPPPQSESSAAVAFLCWLDRLSGIIGFDCHCPFFDDTYHCVVWLRKLLQVFVRFDSLWPGFGCVFFSIPVPSIDFAGDGFFPELSSILQLLGAQWQIQCGVSCTSLFGDVVAAPRWFLFGLRRNYGRMHPLTFPPVVEEATPFSTIVDCSLDDPMASFFTFRGRPRQTLIHVHHFCRGACLLRPRLNDRDFNMPSLTRHFQLQSFLLMLPIFRLGR